MTDSPHAPLPKTSAAQKRGMVLVVCAQCFGALSGLVFQKGLVLLYPPTLGLPESRALLYISLVSFGNLPSIYFACVADRKGLKRVGTPGVLLGIVGATFLPLAALFTDPLHREVIIVCGIIIYAFGGSSLAGTWFPLLRPLIPEHLRGRFLVFTI